VPASTWGRLDARTRAAAATTRGIARSTLYRTIAHCRITE
jgi:hypothetical protein